MSNDPHMVQDFGQQELVRVVRNILCCMENSVQNMIGQRIGQRMLSDAMPMEIFGHRGGLVLPCTFCSSLCWLPVAGLDGIPMIYIYISILIYIYIYYICMDFLSMNLLLKFELLTVLG